MAETHDLSIVSPLDGIHRVTLFEVGEAGLTPIAERLVYRQPARTLEVAVDLAAGALPAGQNRVSCAVKGKDELGGPLSFWALASVTDERFADEQPESSPAAQFLIFGDETAGDLIDQPLLAEPAGLDLALGVLGWRQTAGKVVAVAADRDRVTAPATFFYRAAPDAGELRRRLTQRLHLAGTALTQATVLERGQLSTERAELIGALNIARTELETLAEQPHATMLLVLGMLSLTSLVIGALALAWGLARLVRGRAASMPFGVACASIAACLLLLLFRPQERTEDQSTHVAEAAPKRIEEGKRDAAGEALALPQVQTESETRLGMPQREADALRRDGAVQAGQPAPGGAGGPLQQSFPGAYVANRAPVTRTDGYGSKAHPEAESQRQSRKLELESQDASGASGRGRAKQSDVAPPPGPTAPMTANTAASKSGILKEMVKGAAVNVVPTPNPVEGAADERAAVDRLLKDVAKSASGDLGRLRAAYEVRRNGDPSTLLWNPAWLVPARGASLVFDLPPGPARYRIVLFGHTEDGRFGFFEDRLHVTAQGR